jgi:two-component system, cell cycle response regulator
MDGMDGFQTCRAIKKMPAPTGLKPIVILLSSRGGVIDKMRGSLAGADAYLTKPLNDVDLNKLLAKHEIASGASFAASRAHHVRNSQPHQGGVRSTGRPDR